MNKKLYYQALCSCLAGQSVPVDSPNWSWEQFLVVAADETVLPALFSRIHTPLPPDVTDFFSALKALSLERNRKILAEAEKIATLLNGCGIEAVFLKGIAYLRTGVYVDYSERFISDIDVLVAQAQLPAAVEALRGAGYLESDPRPIASAGHHHTLLYRPDEFTYGVEVHRSIGLAACEALLPAREILADAKICDGSSIRVPCPEHLVIHHVAHSQIHHEYHERIWPSLRGLYDLLLLTRRFPALDWNAIGERFRRRRQYGTWALYATQVQATFNAEVPFYIRQNWLTRFRHRRRQALRAFPVMRRLDPLYIFKSSVLPRLRLLPYFLAATGGRRYIIKRALHPTFYRHLLADVGNITHFPPEY